MPPPASTPAAVVGGCADEGVLHVVAAARHAGDVAVPGLPTVASPCRTGSYSAEGSCSRGSNRSTRWARQAGGSQGSPK